MNDDVRIDYLVLVEGNPFYQPLMDGLESYGNDSIGIVKRELKSDLESFIDYCVEKGWKVKELPKHIFLTR